MKKEMPKTSYRGARPRHMDSDGGVSAGSAKDVELGPDDEVDDESEHGVGRQEAGQPRCVVELR